MYSFNSLILVSLCASQIIGERPRCKSMPNLSNANLNSMSGCMDKPCGFRCYFECEEGYKKKGTNMYCFMGNWLLHGAACEPIKCYGRPHIPNADEKSLQGCTSISAGGTCQFTCYPGFRREGDRVSCSQAGDWHVAGAGCHLIKCPQVQNILGVDPISVKSCVGSTPGTKCNVKCLEGYQRKDTSDVVCGNDGKWMAEHVKCEKGGCNSKPEVEHAGVGSLEQCTGSPLGSSCEFDCKDGFKRVGILSCTYDGKWKTSEAYCELELVPIDANK